MLKAIIISVVLLGIAVLGMCVRIIIKKNGTFHSQDVGQSKAMHDRGIGCTRSQDRQAQRGNPLRLKVDEL
ncbi:MAG: hypothetical protein IKO63_06095 [Paludibacteraceae bacterium]|nr:hypothetical protein [Paludibacteraceae bacterium]